MNNSKVVNIVVLLLIGQFLSTTATSSYLPMLADFIQHNDVQFERDCYNVSGYNYFWQGSPGPCCCHHIWKLPDKTNKRKYVYLVLTDKQFGVHHDGDGGGQYESGPDHEMNVLMSGSVTRADMFNKKDVITLAKDIKKVKVGKYDNF